jgi:hypothetical protein
MGLRFSVGFCQIRGRVAAVQVRVFLSVFAEARQQGDNQPAPPGPALSLTAGRPWGRQDDSFGKTEGHDAALSAAPDLPLWNENGNARSERPVRSVLSVDRSGQKRTGRGLAARGRAPRNA